MKKQNHPKMYYIVNQNLEILAMARSHKIAKMIRQALLEEKNYKIIGIMEV